MIELTCPLVGVDLETTGIYRRVDRIVQIALVRHEPDGSRREWSSYVNPGLPIPPETTAIHGITDERVATAPTFAQLAPYLSQELSFVDFFGFHVSFDLEILANEFARVGVKPSMNGRVIDASEIFRRYRRRTLSAAVEEYLGTTHDGAHDALADIVATERVLLAQLERHGADLPTTIRELHDLLWAPRPDWVDPKGKLVWRYGEPAVAFGEQAGVRLRKLPRRFLRWILRKDFSDMVKHCVQDALDGKFWKREDMK